MYSRISVSVLLLLLLTSCYKDPKVDNTRENIIGSWILVSTSGPGGIDIPVLPWQKQVMEIYSYRINEYAHDTVLIYDQSLDLQTYRGTVCRVLREYTNNDSLIIKYEQIFRRRDTLVRFMTETPGAVAYRYLPYKP